MTEQPDPPLRRQPPVRRPGRATPWPMIAGVVLLAVLALALLAVLLTRSPGTASGSPTPSASTSAEASSPESGSPLGSQSAPASPSDGASPPPAPDLAHDSIAATTVDGLTVRAEPGLGGTRLGTLAGGMQAFVVDGPTSADGLPWYLVSALGLPPNTGCAGPLETDPFSCPVWFGWVAAADENGEPWLASAEIDCPTPPLSAEAVIVGRTPLERLACFGSEPITFRAWWPELPDDAGLGGACTAEATPSGWLICQNINYNQVTINENEGFGGVGVRVSIDPASGVGMPERGTWVEVRAHLDHPTAQRCGEDALGAAAEERPPEQLVLACRAELVLESVQAVDGP